MELEIPSTITNYKDTLYKYDDNPKGEKEFFMEKKMKQNLYEEERK